jgi:hypothetical protein
MSCYLEKEWTLRVFIVVFLHLSVGLLNFVRETQQQERNIIHTTTTLSQARYRLAATSSGELVFFAGGFKTTGPSSDRVDMFAFKKVLYLNGPFSIPNRTYSPPYRYLDV